ncbi:MAG: tyrosine-type recombinase/integrase [Candidatus Xenobia bacterium]
MHHDGGQLAAAGDAAALVVAGNGMAGLVAASVAAAERHPVAVYLARLSVRSRRTMEGALHTVAGLLTGGRADAWRLEWAALGYQHVAAVRTALVEMRGLAPASANLHISALRGVLREAWRLGLMSAEAAQRAGDVPRVRGTTLPRGRALDSGELRALFDVCARDGGPGALRDAALLALLYGAGLRRSEAVALDVADWNSADGCVTVRHGKGNKARQTYLSAGGAKAVADWLAQRGTAPGPLLCPVNKGGRITLRRLSDHAAYDVMLRRASAAGVAACSPHDMRRTNISHLFDAGADVAVVKQMVGHANVETTARYDRRGEVAKKKAAGLLHVPWR